MTNYKLMMLGITVLFLASQILILLGLAGEGHFDYCRSVMVTACFWIVYTLLETRYGLYLNNYIRALMVLTLVSDGFFGYYLDLYATSTIFDKFLHAFGTYSLSLFAYVLVVQLLDKPVKRSFKFILVVCLGLSIGAFYEIIEFITDSISHPVPPSQPSLLDTDLDLIGDTIGALLAAMHATYRTFIDRDF
jgi:uncharacterized membrane protein YjdF